MTHFQLFIILLFLKSFMPRFGGKRKTEVEAWYKDDTERELDPYKAFSNFVQITLSVILWWLSSGYLLPYANKYLPL